MSEADNLLLRLREKKDRLEFERIEMMIRHDRVNRRFLFVFSFFAITAVVLTGIRLFLEP